MIKVIQYLLINFAACGIMGLILFNTHVILAVRHLIGNDDFFNLFVVAVYIMGIIINSLIYYLTFLRRKYIKKRIIKLIILYAIGTLISAITVSAGMLLNFYLFFRFGY